MVELLDVELFTFQETAVTQMLSFLEKKQAVYNACEMGLGKSAQALTCAKRLRLTSILIICPAGVTFVWRNELKKWYPECPGAHILSYGMLQNKKARETINRPWDLLILDEAHYVKNPKAKRTKIVLFDLWPLAKYRICLSGTPMTQSVADCYTLFSKILPAFGGYWDFCGRYAHIKRTPWGQKPHGIKNAEELRKIIRSHFFVRYLKTDVLKDLPAKTWVKVPLPRTLAVKLSAEEEKKAKEYIRAMQLFFQKGVRVPLKPPKSVATYRAEQGLKKVPHVVDFARDILEQEIPLVIFAYHRSVLEALRTHLAPFHPAYIDGSTSATARDKAVTAFQNGSTNLFIGQIVAAGTGITLTRASTVVFAELDWSPANVSQAVDRVHRISQDLPVTSYYFSVDGSIDEDLMDTLIEKLESFIAVVN